MPHNLPFLARRSVGETGSSLTNVVTITIIVLILLGLAALAGGIVIALLASRSAPDGFEDQEGFHLGRVPPVHRK